MHLWEPSAKELCAEDKQTVLSLLEMQRDAMLMYTSCGWFFDDVSGLESVQILQYAGKALQLSSEFDGEDLENKFLDRLVHAESNIPDMENGKNNL